MICVSLLGSPKQLCEGFEAVPQGTSQERAWEPNYFMFLGQREQVRFYCLGLASWTWDIWNKAKEEPCYWLLNHCTDLLPMWFSTACFAHVTCLYFIRIPSMTDTGHPGMPKHKNGTTFNYSISHNAILQSMFFKQTTKIPLSDSTQPEVTMDR